MTWEPGAERDRLEAELRTVGTLPDEAVDLAGTALLLAALARPRVSLERYRHHLSLLARDTADAGEGLEAAASLDGRLAALRAILVERYDYAGDEESYDDLQNADLTRVIDRRRGLPVTLGILYLHAARAQGWPAEGLAFPGHFLIRLDHEGERAIVDPFAGGLRRDAAELRDLLKVLHGSAAELTPEAYAPVGNRAILLRLQNNIKLRLLRDQRPEDALRTIEAMLLFAPEQAASLWREAGLLHTHLGNLRAGAEALERFLLLAPGDRQSHEAATLLQKLRRQLN